MQKDESSAHQAIQNAIQALKQGDQATAQLWAERAASLAPHLEQPWLILAAVSSPRASIAYLEKALQINPESSQAKQALSWARKKLEQVTPHSDPIDPKPNPSPGVKMPAPVSAPVNPMQARSELKPGRQKKASRKPARRALWLIFAILSILVIATWFLWPGNVSPALALIHGDNAIREYSYSAPVDIAKPTYTPSPTLTFTPSTTPFPTSTPTDEPTQSPSDTPTLTPSLPPTDLPTSTLIPVDSATPFAPDTNTPEPGNQLPITYIVQNGDTLYSIAQQLGVDVDALAAVNGMSSWSTLYIGQELAIPQPGQYIPPPQELPTSQKSIVVYISQQHLYAYEGDVLIYSFVASTGMNNATRVGTFSVLDKIPNAYGSTWNIWMPNWLGIYYSGYLENGIHALPILSNGSRLWEGYLGRPISYGCVVLGTYESQLLYDWAEVGTVVEIRP